LSVDTSQDPGTVPPSPFDAEPTARVRAPWITGFVLAGLGWQVASQVPTTFTVPQQIKDIDPAGHVADFAWVNSIGTLSILFLGPLFGMLSDRTVSRFGRRRPWIAFGGMAAAAALVFSGTQNSVWGVGLGYLLQTVFVAALAAGMVTIVPDRVPAGQRGVVLGWGGVPQAAALIVGGVLVSLSKGCSWCCSRCGSGIRRCRESVGSRSASRLIWPTTGSRCGSTLISDGRWRHAS
jgi:MFS family permease